MKNKKNLISAVEAWLKDYELATDSCYGDEDTLDGSAYVILNYVLVELKKLK